jgi:biotin carboxyl carrier protein
MPYAFELNGRKREVAVLSRDGDTFAVTVDGGPPVRVDVKRVDSHSFSLIVGEPGRPDADTAASEGKEPATAGGGSSHDVTLAADAVRSELIVHVGTVPVVLALDARRRPRRAEAGAAAGSRPERLVSPMSGRVVRVLVGVGHSVRARQPLVVVEAMKMENELRAARDGTVAEVRVREGMSVDAGSLLVVIQ